MRKISIVVPFFNEEKIIREKIHEINKYCDKHFNNYEIIFVNDGSSDRSGEIVKKFIKPFSNLHIITYEKNYGRGEAIRKGLRVANGEVVGYIDSDLEIKLKYIDVVLKNISQYDIIIASKFVKNAIVDTPKIRRVSSELYNKITKLLLNSKISDHQAGFKFFKKDVIKKLLPLTNEKGWLWDTEVLYLAQRKHYNILEIPITISYGYRKMRLSFFSDFLKLPFVILGLKRKLDKKINEKK